MLTMCQQKISEVELCFIYQGFFVSKPNLQDAQTPRPTKR